MGREEPLPTPERDYQYPRISPDGTRLALDIRDQEEDIWIWDFTRLHTDAPHVRCESRSVPGLDAG